MKRKVESRIDIKQDPMTKLWCHIQRLRALNGEIRRLRREVLMLSYLRDTGEEFSPEIIGQLAAAYELRAILVQETRRLARRFKNA